MEIALRNLLLGSAAIAALVVDRVSWTQKAQNSGIPYIVLSKVSATRTYTNKGPDGVVSSRIQFDIDASTQSGCVDLARLVIDLLSGYQDFNTGGWFQGIFLEAERESFEGSDTVDDLYRVSLDFMIYHKEK